MICLNCNTNEADVFFCCDECKAKFFEIRKSLDELTNKIAGQIESGSRKFDIDLVTEVINDHFWELTTD